MTSASSPNLKFPAPLDNSSYKPPLHETLTNPEHNTSQKRKSSSPPPPSPAPNSHPKQHEPSRKNKKPTKPPHILHTTTLRALPWTYFHLRLTTPSCIPSSASSASSASNTSPFLPSQPAEQTQATRMDELLISTLLTHAMNSYLGLVGASIPVDILHTSGVDVLVRIPRQDARALRAGIASWIGSADGESVPGCKEQGRVKVAWRVVGEGGTVGGTTGDGMGLFGKG